jgi:hypothetical protein
VNGKKIKEPTEDEIKLFKKTHTFRVDNYGNTKDQDLTKPLKIDFQGYYGFLTPEDKKGSSEGSETFGLTKTEEGRVAPGNNESRDMDDEGNPKNYPPHPQFSSFGFVNDGIRPIKIGFEKKMFFNRLGYER